MKIARKCLASGAMATALLFAAIPSSFADAPPDITPEEAAMLPRWCMATSSFQRGPGARAQYEVYMNRYGGGFSHMHHYCWALIDIMRMDRIMARSNRGWASWGRALDNIDYVLRNTEEDPGFQFRAEILARRARLLARFAPKPEAAVKTAEQLIHEWPKIPDGYIILADVLLRAGHRQEALAVLEKGEGEVTDKESFARQKSILKLN